MIAVTRARSVSTFTLWTAEAIGLGWALALALFTGCCFALYLLGVPFAAAILPALAVTAGGAILCCLKLWAARCEESVTTLVANGAASAAVLGVIALQVALAARTAWHAPFSAFDAWSVWAFKARMFAMGGPRAGYFRDPTTLHTHPDYPLNLPLAEAALFRLPGALGYHLAALLGVACFATLLLLFFAGLTRLYGGRGGALGTVVLAFVPALALQAPGGNADVPLALYGGGASLYLLLWRRLRRPIDGVIMGLLAGGAIWTKKEGSIIAALVLLVFVVGEAGRRDLPAPARLIGVTRAIVAAAVLSLPWLLFMRVAHPLGRDFLPLTPAVFLAHAGRLPHIAALFGLQMLDVENWSALWVALAGALFVFGRRLSASGWLLLLVLCAQIGAYMTSFVFSDWQPYIAHVQTSVDRLLIQAAPLAVLVLVEAVETRASRRAMRPAPPDRVDRMVA